VAVTFKRRNKASRAEGRQVQRCEVDWTTQYTLEGARGHGWRECRVVNVSRVGVGLLLSGTTVAELSGNRVIVAVDVPRASLRLRGDVRHLDMVEEGRVRVGVDFAAMSVFERDMFDSFLEASSFASKAA
jgi:PilZ domain-containing protein